MPIPKRSVHDCPVEACLVLLSGRWKALLLWKLGRRSMRFGQVCRALPRASKKMLVQRLRELEADGLIRRSTVAGKPPGVDYALTTRGASLLPLLELSAAWTAADAAGVAGSGSDSD
jgi:DNA-binding HxlR family transcriptional regulator